MPKNETGTELALSSLDKAAILMLSLGEHHAGQVFKHLKGNVLQEVGITMASLKKVDKKEADKVIAEFLGEVEQQTGLAVGTESYLRKTLIGALGDDAKPILEQIMMGANTKGLDALKWTDPRMIADMIKSEHPQIQAIVLSYMEPESAAEVLCLLPDDLQSDLSMRIATLEAIPPAALQELNAVMEKQFSNQSTPAKTVTMVGGVSKVADIMNFVETPIEEKIIESIKSIDESMGDKIKEMMFVFDNLYDVDDRGVQRLLRDVDTNKLGLALKAADQRMQDKFFNNMSKRAADLLKDDLEAMGPVKLSDVQQAQRDIVSVAQRLGEEGEIMLGGKGEEMV